MRRTVRAARTAAGRGRIVAEGYAQDQCRCKIVGKEAHGFVLLVELIDARPPLSPGDRLRIGVNEFAPDEVK